MNDLRTNAKRFIQGVMITAAGVALGVPGVTNTVQAAQCGKASWYALDGNRTASGEIMNSARMTAAHRTLPFGTRVRVRNRRNGRSVVVRINDRGPFTHRRIIDVSRAAARKLGFVGRGSAHVCLGR